MPARTSRQSDRRGAHQRLTESPPTSASGTKLIDLFLRPRTADRRAASPRIRAASLPTQRPSPPNFAMPQSESLTLEDIAAPNPATHSRACLALHVAETRLCPTVPPEASWDQRRPGVAARRRTRRPRRRLWPSTLPITEAGPRGARIKPATRAAPSATAIHGRRGQPLRARVARCRGIVGGIPKVSSRPAAGLEGRLYERAITARKRSSAQGEGCAKGLGWGDWCQGSCAFASVFLHRDCSGWGSFRHDSA
jgi:hypothetical protein